MITFGWSGSRNSQRPGTEFMEPRSRCDSRRLVFASRSTSSIYSTLTSNKRTIHKKTSLPSFFIYRVSPDFHFKREIILYRKEINIFLNKPKHLNFSEAFRPWRATTSDQDRGLNVELRSENNSDTWWCSKYEGFRYFIHAPNELLSSINTFQLQFGELTEVLIKPKMTITEDDLRDYTFER